MKKYKFEIILGLAISVFVLVFSYLSIKRHLTLHSYYYDLGIMNQVVDNTSRGRFLEMTNQQLGRNANRLAIHFDPILAAFAPFYWIYRDPSVLLVGQVLIVGMGAWAVYLIANRILKKKLISLVFALLYLLFFQNQRAVLFDFHAVTLATSFMLFAFYFNLVKKQIPYFVFLVLALLTKEHVGMIVIMFGFYLFFVKGEKKTAIATAILGAVFFVMSVYVLIPYFRQQDHFALKYFETLGGSPSKVLVNVLIRPRYVFGMILGDDSINYSLRLIAPVFYAVFSPLSLLIALPEWAINTISINPNMRAYHFHYSSLIVPVLFYSLIIGYRNFDIRFKNKKIKGTVFVIFIIMNILSFVNYNPVPSPLVKRPASYKEIDPVKKRTLNFLMSRLKDDNIKLSTTPRLAPFFTNRRYYHNFLYDTAFSAMGQTEEDVIKAKLGTYVDYDYVIIDFEEIGDLDSGSLPVKFYQHLKDNDDYEMILTDDNDIQVFKKKTGDKPLFEDSEI